MKYLIITLMLILSLPVLAEEEIHLNSMDNFSGYYNKSRVESKYPSLTVSNTLRRPAPPKTSAKEINVTPAQPKVDGPRNYQMLQNYDSSNSMFLMQQSIPTMLMHNPY